MLREKLIRAARRVLESDPCFTSPWESNIFQEARKAAHSILKILQEDFQAANDSRLQARLLVVQLSNLEKILERWKEIETNRQGGVLEEMPPLPLRRPRYLRSGSMMNDIHEILFDQAPPPPGEEENE